MVYYYVKVKVKGHGGLRLGKPLKMQLPDWDEYVEGGRVYEECYQGTPRIPHFLFIYYKQYTVEYHVNEVIPDHLLSPEDISVSRLNRTIKPLPGSIICYKGKQYLVTIGEKGKYLLSYFQTNSMVE